MLHELVLRPVTIPAAETLPAFLQPLIDAAAAGHVNLSPVVAAVVQSFGFDSMTYGATAETDARPDHETRAFVYTTQPRAWVGRYDQMAYVEVDPRVQDTWDNPVPLVWDQTSFVGRSERTLQFLAEAAQHGIRSGVAMSFHTGARRHVVFNLNSEEAVLSPVRRNHIDRSLGDIYLFGTTFHAIFLKGSIEAGVAPILQGLPLSARERELTACVARGLTDEDMARVMGCSTATIATHINNARSKMGASNRAELVRLAAKAGFIKL